MPPVGEFQVRVQLRALGSTTAPVSPVLDQRFMRRITGGSVSPLKLNTNWVRLWLWAFWGRGGSIALLRLQ